MLEAQFMYITADGKKCDSSKVKSEEVNVFAMQIFHDLFSILLLCYCNWWKLWEDQPDSSTSWSVIVHFIVNVCDIGTRNFTAVRALEVTYLESKRHGLTAVLVYVVTLSLSVKPELLERDDFGTINNNLPSHSCAFMVVIMNKNSLYFGALWWLGFSFFCLFPCFPASFSPPRIIVSWCWWLPVVFL